MIYELRIEVNYEKKDFYEFNYWTLRKFKKSYLIFMLIWFLFMICILAVNKSLLNGSIMKFLLDNRWLFTIPILTSLFVGIVYLNVYTVGKRFVNNNPLWLEKKMFIFNNSGITVESKSTNVHFDWNLISRFEKLNNLYVFYYSKESTLLLPKKFIEDENSFMKIVNENLC